MRNNSISIAKAIAIMLMVLAHTYFSDYGNRFINMFHMPLFFFFSGYCFKDKYLNQPLDFIRKRIKGLYKPFVKWSIIFLLLHNIFFYLNIYNDEYGFRGNVSHLYHLSDFLSRLIHIITRMTDNEQLLGGYWFLRSLLVCSIIGFITVKYNKKPFIGGGVILLITIVLSAYNLQIPYFSIGAREAFAAIFFISGYYYKKYNFQVHEHIYILIFGTIGVFVGEKFWQASLLNFKWYQIVPYTVTALFGILAIYCLSKKLLIFQSKIQEYLIYIGNNTLTILTWHFLCFKLVSLIIIIYYKEPIARLAEFPVITEYSRNGWFIIYFLFGILIPIRMSKYTYLK